MSGFSAANEICFSSSADTLWMLHTVGVPVLEDKKHISGAPRKPPPNRKT